MELTHAGPAPLAPAQIEILLVEDNLGDVRLTREELKDSKLLNNLHVVYDGVEALRFLQREGPYAEVPRPDLILLDLDLPKLTGQEVLERIKADPSLASIPVVVLTASRVEQDILRTHKLNVACYVTKPIDLAQFRQVVGSIEEIWFSLVRVQRSA